MSASHRWSSGNQQATLFLTRRNEVLKVNEIFYSIQGESSRAGFPCVFVRLTGCNLRCTYCDTKYAYRKGRNMSVEEINELVSRYECPLVEITGGEPLLQEETPKLAQDISERGCQVIVETNGTQNISLLPSGIICIVDIKCPGSGESEKTDWENLDRLGTQDEVKFVLTAQSDYTWAKEVIRSHHLTDRVTVHLSPAHGKLTPAELAHWILEDGLNVRLQLQLHKILWPNEDRGR